jgi:hypothetical protein
MKSLRVIAIAIAVLIGIGFLCWNIPVGKTDAGNQVIVGDYIAVIFPQKQAVQQPSEAKGPVINADAFDLLKPGVTTYSLLSKYIGPGELQSSNNVGDANNEGRVWRNPDGSEVFLVFQNGVLISKSQRGLQ